MDVVHIFFSSYRSKIISLCSWLPWIETLTRTFSRFRRSVMTRGSGRWQIASFCFLEKKHITYLCNNMHPWWNRNPNALGQLGKRSNYSLRLFHRCLFFSKPIRSETIESSVSTEPIQPSSSLSQSPLSQISMTRRSRKEITPFQRNIQTLRRLLRKL